MNNKDKQRAHEYKQILDMVEGRLCMVTIVPTTKLSEFLRNNTGQYEIVVNGRVEYALSA